MKSFIRYWGGKNLLSEKIISMIPQHRTYIELFCGASWVLFKKPKSNIEVINDKDQQLINLYFVVKYQLNEFIEQLNLMPISEDLFNLNRYHKGIPVLDLAGEKGIPILQELFLKKEGDIELATITYYNIMNSFKGNISNKLHFHIDKNKVSSFVKFYKTDWIKVSERLKEVSIINRDFRNIIELYDSEYSIFYIDPPYLKSDKNYYKCTFENKDHLELLELLKNIKGNFILSYENDDKIKSMYQDFNIIELEQYEKELLITNYDVPEKSYYSGAQKGIPKGSMEYKSNWKNKNCPYCNSRKIKKMYERLYLENGGRTFKHCGFKCVDCNRLFSFD